MYHIPFKNINVTSLGIIATCHVIVANIMLENNWSRSNYALAGNEKSCFMAQVARAGF